MSGSLLSGRVWVLGGEDGALIENIDTDQIFHNAHLHITDVTRMGVHALGNLKGWEDFSSRAAAGDLIFAGRNFGAGSSRQQAVDCFRTLGIRALVAPSFGAIYFRNAVNSGFTVIRCPELAALVAGGGLETGDEVELDVLTGQGCNRSRDRSLIVLPMSRVQWEIFQAGGLFGYGRQMTEG